MNRRQFVAAAAALLLASPSSLAQQSRRRVGVLALNELTPSWQTAWLDGLRDHGWIDGSNLSVEYRYARSQDRFPALATELVVLRPDLVGGTNPQAVTSLKAASTSIPTMFVGVADPVGIGLVQSLSHPGGNITGLATFVPGQFISKQIQVFRELVPATSKIAVLANPSNPIHRKVITEELPQTARQLGVTLPVVEASTVEEFDAAFDA